VESIEDLLQAYPPNQRQVRFSFECRENGYVVLAMLVLPTGTLIARTDGAIPDHRAAINQVVAGLANAIRRHEQEPPMRRCRRDANEFLPHLEAMRREEDEAGFQDLLRPPVAAA